MGYCSNNHYVSGDFCKLCEQRIKPEKAKVYAIRKKSVKREKEEIEYNAKKKKHLKDNPYCQARLIGCSKRSIDLHHKAGRVGSNYLNEETFMAVCRNCHSKIHDVLSSKEAKEKDLKI